MFLISFNIEEVESMQGCFELKALLIMATSFLDSLLVTSEEWCECANGINSFTKKVNKLRLPSSSNVCFQSNTTKDFVKQEFL